MLPFLWYLPFDLVFFLHSSLLNPWTVPLPLVYWSHYTRLSTGRFIFPLNLLHPCNRFPFSGTLFEITIFVFAITWYFFIYPWFIPSSLTLFARSLLYFCKSLICFILVSSALSCPRLYHRHSLCLVHLSILIDPYISWKRRSSISMYQNVKHCLRRI